MKKILIVLAICLIPLTAKATNVIIDWTAATQNAAFNTLSWFSAVTFTTSGGNARIWVVGGLIGTSKPKDVWYSYNGADWMAITKNAAFDGVYNANLLSYNNKMWLIGGYTGSNYLKSVWYSYNGADWYAATKNAEFPASVLSCCVYNNKMWATGGKEVYSSSNGNDWTAETLNAEFDSAGGNLVNFLNTLTFVDYVNQKVWTSTDGKSWTKICDPLPISARLLSGVVVYGNNLWVLGGLTTSSEKDTWRSDDGINWVQDSNATWPGRYYPQPIVCNNKLVIIGGTNGVEFTNDVWVANLTAPTSTPTISPTITATITQSVTKTVTKTVTQTITQTITPYATSTITATITQTLTITETITPTWTSSVTETMTPIYSATITQTITPQPTPELSFKSVSKCGFQDSIKVQWTRYNTSPEPNYILYVNDYYKELSPSANESSFNPNLFVYTVKDLSYNVSYAIAVSATSSEWNIGVISNIITVELKATETPTP